MYGSLYPWPCAITDTACIVSPTSLNVAHLTVSAFHWAWPWLGLGVSRHTPVGLGGRSGLGLSPHRRTSTWHISHTDYCSLYIYIYVSPYCIHQSPERRSSSRTPYILIHYQIKLSIYRVVTGWCATGYVASWKDCISVLGFSHRVIVESGRGVESKIYT